MVAEFDPNATERTLMVEYARTLDELDALSAIIAASPTETGSQGQVKLSGAFAAANAARAILVRLATALGIEDEDGTPAVTKPQQRASHAAARARRAQGPPLGHRGID
ncbi:hypothetical protein [Pseudonocardia acidicola]|uniref:Terminase small subunit n=1 Tax=Pseudonocardia acidicola TaxID=2724939 RepID=A0ABX1SGP6_9PSEU|nr:hypothetical protein [Pseudonocardia acidicola]NMI00731.1 hypothetical protein [Pseudonocardia acidicola]